MQSSAMMEDQKPAGAVAVSDIAVGVIIARTSEFFEFFVFAIAATLVFPKVIFPFASPVEAMLLSFATLALGFVARPIGTLIFTEIDRRYGRGTKLTIALFLLGTSTVAIAFLPGYNQEGWLTVASLCLLRMGQGAALGGTWDGMSSLLAMNAPEGRKGQYAVIPQLGAPLGAILAGAMFVYFYSALSPEEFLDFGWRFPFFVAFAINVVALFARLRMTVSEEFEELYSETGLQPAPPLETVRDEWRNIWIGSFTPLATLALFHMVTVFPLAWAALYYPDEVINVLMLELFAAVIGVITLVYSGRLADRIGRRTVLMYGAYGIAIYALVAPLFLNNGIIGESAYIIVGYVLLGFSFSQSSGAVAAGFQLRHRYMASNLTADLAWMFGAGFAPFVSLLVSELFGAWASGLYLLSGAIMTIIALNLYNRRQCASDGNNSTKNTV